MDNLTEKQERFAVEYVKNGGNATQAYKKVYDVGENAPNNSIWTSAHKVRTNSKVSSRIHALKMASFGNDIMTIKERKRVLTALALEGDTKSIDLLNKMDNIYTEKSDDHDPQPTHIIYNVIPKK